MEHGFRRPDRPGPWGRVKAKKWPQLTSTKPKGQNKETITKTNTSRLPLAGAPGFPSKQTRPWRSCVRQAPYILCGCPLKWGEPHVAPFIWFCKQGTRKPPDEKRSSKQLSSLPPAAQCQSRCRAARKPAGQNIEGPNQKGTGAPWEMKGRPRLLAELLRNLPLAQSKRPSIPSTPTPFPKKLIGQGSSGSTSSRSLQNNDFFH